MAIETTDKPNSAPTVPGDLDFLTVADLQSIFGASLRTIHRWNQAAILPKPAKRVGRLLRWKTSDIVKMVDASEQS